ncbi:MAG: hypothetical protein VYB37_04245 [Pseudomonadota bacterium]|nr:hypothetical protein [Pseudomonadota bacterium]
MAGFAVAIGRAGGAGASDLYLLPGDPEKGQARCTVCHETQFGGDGSGIDERSPQRVRSIEELMKQVAFCNRQTLAGLNEYEEEDIVAYLNEAFYRFTMD